MNENTENINYNLLTAYLAGETDSKETEEVKLWLSASEENRSYFESIKNTWIEIGKVKSAPVEVNVDDAWNRISEKIDFSEKKEIKIIPINNSFKFYALRIAAVIIVAVCIFTVYQLSITSIENLTIASTENIITDSLSDGSVIALNLNSTLTYPENFEGKTRNVKLEGEAFFEIAHKPEKPFIIQTGDVFVQVLGTSFNVKAYSKELITEITVATGIVKVFTVNATGDTTSMILKAGSKGLVNKKTKDFTKEVSYDKNTLFWKHKTLIFEETELSKVFEIIEHYYSVEIEADLLKIGGCKLSASFNNEDVGVILNIIAETFNLSLSTTNNKKYNVEGEGC